MSPHMKFKSEVRTSWVNGVGSGVGGGGLRARGTGSSAVTEMSHILTSMALI